MASKLIAVLVALLLGVAFVNCSNPDLTDPESEVIDEEQFREKWLLSSDAVDQRNRELDEAEQTGGQPGFDENGNLIIIPTKPTCEEGPNVEVFREDGYYYYPLPQYTSCGGLDCTRYYDEDHVCAATKTCTRKFYTICYKQFNCWGLTVWIPIGIRQLHLVDESYCECKPPCRPFSCFLPRYFNPDTCDCTCPNITCYKPYTLDESSCECRCPKDIICKYPTQLNLTTCECECKNECQPYYKPDPEKNCTCVPICRHECPKGSYLDLESCKCVGDCGSFRNEYDCNAVDSCKESRSQKCRWDPSYPYNPCQCDCCRPRDGYSDYDCSRFTGLGRFGCNFHYNWGLYANPCYWACGH